MPQLTVEGYGTFEVAADKRLVLAIEQDAHVDILHACGGNARCTTCRVEFISGEPPRMTIAEKTRMEEKGLVSSADGDGGRRTYRPTALGERALLAARIFSGQLKIEAET